MFEGTCNIVDIMKTLNIGCVLDVGANTGQFAKELLGRGFRGVLVSFEPLTDCYHELRSCSEAYPNWHCFNLALGSQDGETIINVSAHSQSSSILPVKAWSVEAYAPIAPIARQTVQVRRLDSLWPDMWSPAAPRPLMLKIDVQGFESQVLEGLGRHLDEVDLLLLETALISSYEGAEPFEVMVADLRNKGFYPVWMRGGWGDPQTGQVFECDIAFARTPLIK